MACFFSSCEKESKPSDCLTTNDVSLEQFSVLLSKAVYSEPDLREFIKSEALAKKDYDSDVFYPFVKDEIVDGTRTFEEILKQYDDGNVLQTVLARHPLLTIFVPDWSWIKDDCFSVENWDCSLPTIETTESSDNLGSFVVQYKDKIVLGQKNSKFRIKTYSTGSVDAQIIAFYE